MLSPDTSRGTAGRYPCDGLSCPYAMNPDQFPGASGPFGGDVTIYVVPDNHEINLKTIIGPLTPLVTALYAIDANSPDAPGSYDTVVQAELKDAAGATVARVSAGVTGSLEVDTDSFGTPTAARASASCSDVTYQNVLGGPIVTCNSQRVISNDSARLSFTDFIRLYPDAIDNYPYYQAPACLGVIWTIS